jgi:Zn-dependent protease with chaperone function
MDRAREAASEATASTRRLVALGAIVGAGLLGVGLVAHRYDAPEMLGVLAIVLAVAAFLPWARVAGVFARKSQADNPDEAALAALRDLAGPSAEFSTVPEPLEPLRQWVRDQGGEGVDLRFFRRGDGDEGAFAGLLCAGDRSTVALDDELPTLLDIRELRVAAAHELSHARAVWAETDWDWAVSARLVAAGAMAAMLHVMVERDALGAIAWGGPVAMLMGWLVLLAAVPIRAARLRRDERAANNWALRATNDPAAMISGYTKLAQLAGATEAPGVLAKLLGASHPSLAEQVDQARRYAADHGISL